MKILIYFLLSLHADLCVFYFPKRGRASATKKKFYAGREKFSKNIVAFFFERRNANLLAQMLSGEVSACMG